VIPHNDSLHPLCNRCPEDPGPAPLFRSGRRMRRPLLSTPIITSQTFRGPHTTFNSRPRSPMPVAQPPSNTIRLSLERFEPCQADPLATFRFELFNAVALNQCHRSHSPSPLAILPIPQLTRDMYSPGRTWLSANPPLASTTYLPAYWLMRSRAS